MEKAGGCLAAIDLIVTACAIRHKKGRVAIFFLDPAEFRSHQVKRFIPGNSLKLAFASAPGAFQWIAQAVWMILTTAVSPATRAGPKLRSFNRVGPVIAINSGDDPIFKINTQETPPTAIMRRAASANHHLAPGGSYGCFFIDVWLAGHSCSF